MKLVRPIFAARCRGFYFSFPSDLSAIVAVSLIFILPVARAGRPMAIDDATITDTKGCELETWVQKNPSNTEYWALPACNVNGNLELTLGTARMVSEDRTQTAIVMQGKTLLKPMDTNGWGAGLVMGDQFDPDKSAIGNLYVNVPVSFSLLDDRLFIHVNSGWLHKNEDGHSLMTWGVGSELRLTGRTSFTSEIYRQDVGKPFFQLGLSHRVIPNRLQIDASYGDHLSSGGRSDRFFSTGIVLSTDAIMR